MIFVAVTRLDCSFNTFQIASSNWKETFGFMLRGIFT